MFSGPKSNVKQPLVTEEEFAAKLYPVRSKTIRDLIISFKLGRLKERKVLFKRGDNWGDWPIVEVLEYEAIADAMDYTDKKRMFDPEPLAMADALGISTVTREDNKKSSKTLSSFLKSRMGN